MARHCPVVTIDGPSGVGKGTIGFRLARRLQFHLLESGALYRLLAVAAWHAGVRTGDETALARLAEDMVFDLTPGEEEEPTRATLNGRAVGADLRSERCSREASEVAAWRGVRSALLERQRRFRRPPGLVAEGRDMGTVVFPTAEAKIYLTASPEERARRRHKQLMGKGISVNLARLFDDIVERDRRDRARSASPLRPAEDAVVIDTTQSAVHEVFERVLAEVVAKGVVDGRQ